MIKSFIFDMDGTLVDSMPLHNRAWLEALASLGHHPDPADFVRRATGWANDRIVREFVRPTATAEEIARVVAVKAPIFSRLMASQLRFLAGAEEFLAQARKDGFRLALATAASPDSLGLICDGLGLRSRFDAIVDRSQVEHGKPAPDLFLKAARLLGSPSAECLVFEDSIPGFEAARAAEMPVCALLTAMSAAELHSRNYPHLVAAAPDFTAWTPIAMATQAASLA